MGKESNYATVPRQIVNAFLHLIYPPLCIHCSQGLPNPTHLLCKDCLSLLELINPTERCTFCFSADCDPAQRLCAECHSRYSILDGMGAVFDFVGPAASLMKKMKYSNMPYLAEGIGAYMGAQFCRLDWPMPDLIVPVPITLPHLFQRGYNQSALIADVLAQTLNRPSSKVLKRKSGDFSQAGLNREQRKALKGESFICKKDGCLEDKIVLIVDDVMTTGSTLRCCAEALQAGFPKKIYALAFCRAIK
jgi:competence protein ComFC